MIQMQSAKFGRLSNMWSLYIVKTKWIAYDEKIYPLFQTRSISISILYAQKKGFNILRWSVSSIWRKLFDAKLFISSAQLFKSNSISFNCGANLLLATALPAHFHRNIVWVFSITDPSNVDQTMPANEMNPKKKIEHVGHA